ncbi:MAG TPA: hypothetical protein VEP89_16535, partial [Draconibacterium sp.]|nr:hypothetical protein [Draconibacterium sp.]
MIAKVTKNNTLLPMPPYLIHSVTISFNHSFTKFLNHYFTYSPYAFYRRFQRNRQFAEPLP